MSSMYLAATELTLILPANVSIGTDTGPVKLGEVASIIVECGARFDAAAAKAGYAVPIPTTAAAYPMVQQIVREGAGAKVLDILFPTPRMPLAEEWAKAYAEALKAIMDSKLVLPGAPEDTTETERLLPRSFTTTSTATGLFTGATPFISRDWEP